MRNYFGSVLLQFMIIRFNCMGLCHCEGIVRSNPLDILKEIASEKYPSQ
ncbi:MAG: hypothetical protein HUU08_18095 [Candidatus Brocadia sp.]|nr:hypothetical protein [Candidatus Brocadia sp.]UJS18673.1 MAG: hypothetical protein L3J17_06370 [Candidatus Jettenia sp.]